MAYRYLAYDASGQAVKGRVEVESEERAEEVLGQANLTVISLKKEQRLPSLAEALPTFFGVKRKDLILFTRNLATLLGSGISFHVALKTLRDQTEKLAFKKVLDKLMAEVEAGQSFSQATSHQPAVFPITYFRLVQIGEEIGNLEKVLREVASHMEREEEVVAKVKKALGYPAFVMAVGAVAVVIVMTFVLPSMTRLFAEFRGQLPLPTRILMGISSVSRDYGRYVMMGLIALAGFLWWYLKTPGGNQRKDLVLISVPVAKGVTLHANMSRIARTFSLLLGSGVSLTDSLDLVIQTTPNVTVKKTLAEARGEVHAGQALSQSMRTHHVFPTLFTEMVRIGEETGNLDANLKTLGDFYEGEMDKDIARLTGKIEPALILAVGIMVGFIAISVISPMYSIIQQIK